VTDSTALKSIAENLQATGEFAAVCVGRFPNPQGSTGQSFPRAWLRLTGFKEQLVGDPEEKTRAVSYVADLTVQATDHGDPDAELDRLGNVVANLAEGPSAVPGSVVSWSGVVSGTYLDTPEKPLLTLRLVGGFTYLIDGLGTRDSSP
jgi:hypothetical protein